MADNYSVSAKQRVVNLINEDNPTAHILPDQLSFQTPTPTTLNNRNTIVKAVANYGPIGQRTFYYDRLQLTQFFSETIGTPIPVPVYVANPQSSWDLLDPLFAQYAVRIDPVDVENKPVTGSSLTLKALSTSLGWLGQVVIDIRVPLVNIATLITNKVLTDWNPTIYGVSSVQQLLDQINANNPLMVPLTLSDIMVGSPTELDGDSSLKNTSIQLIGKESNGFTGTVTIKYNRTAPESVYPNPIAVTGIYDPQADTNALLAKLTEHQSVILRPDEIVNVNIDPLAFDAPMSLTLNSEVWLNGTLQWKLPKIPLSAAVNPLWLGFDTAALDISDTDAIASLIHSNFDMDAVVNLTTAPHHAAGFTFTNVTTEWTPVDGRNTSATLTAAPDNALYTGSVVVYYKRVDASVIYDEPIQLIGSPVTPTDTQAVSQLLVSRMGYVIDPSQIVNTPVTGLTVDMVMSTANYVWVPGTVFQVNLPEGEPTSGGYLLMDDGSRILLDSGDGYLLLDDSGD